MFNINSVNKNQLDFFQELENIGASHAATALSVMLDREISIRVPRVQLCEYKEICNILKGPENLVSGLLVGISEDIKGFILLVLDMEDAHTLTKSLIGDIQSDIPETTSDFNELEISALKEAANILIGSYITAISTLTELKIDVSVPELVIDMAGSVMNLLAASYGEYGDSVLFMETEFVDKAQSIFGHFFLIPDIDSYKILLNKMGIN